ncbi:cytochrome b5 reductase 4 [Anastrepha ludens]|uniref:cytochrome b5 reductase 4 n=1 Tax=Anastrepha ludens TaxID=28586 RepID=UPI0023AF20B4|nr:cytochrome b5 reductase 4 [Anastrepha ludens]XP_053962070.1 cytochrome b5 reductase 4 [Anastrepha ludens]XP_053962071.1 cytochrome b5 reductase 4 [Anastrepha ludens]XP_053962072.1 cytochrome b5 reductase 4 [Anastrepha ludens]
MSDSNNISSMSSLQLPTTITTDQRLAPASTAPQKLNSGSATGNPRNKCALKPGHSLMDWIRLGNSGVDLAGTRGRVTPVTTDELALHNKREDAWLAIRGKVYNVTRYMDFHPGGVDELMRGVGRDATKLFDDVHAWVNYQQLLVKCYIGPLRTLVKLNSISEGKPPVPAANFTKPPSSNSVTATSAKVVPRFDWIQKRQDITIYIYTRQLCNPGLILRRNNSTALQLHVQIDQAHHLFAFELHNEVKWPPKSVCVNRESGKVELTLTKFEAALWTTYGAHTASIGSADAIEKLQYEFEVTKCVDFNNDSFELSLREIQDALMVLPIGYHVTVAALINGDLVRRSYTPVDDTFLQQSSTANEVALTNLNFLIKSYNDGILSTHLRQLKTGQMLLLSAPRGNFQLQRLLPHRQIALIAAGSGLTPMLNIIDHLLKRNANRLDYLRLLYFNKTPADIWCHNELERLQATDERFQLLNVLSEADAEWTGLRGRICNELLAPLMTKNTPEYASFVAICGPSGFSEATENILKDLKFNAENVHIFQG